ncbi:MAG TPA: heme o synthase [Candidatus Saccharibacteria bacterium]|nr:heme o synthase [Candidatus Saccharibacteria bacterium]
MRNLFQLYYQLAKPGIVYGNSLHVLAGALLASRAGVDVYTLIAATVGSALIIASACVVNNYTDRRIDLAMERTRKRAFVTGDVSLPIAAVYAMLLFVSGVGVLYVYTNILTLALGLVGYVWYVVIYGIAKRRTVHSTLIGSVPGALPIVAGYTAVTGEIDQTAIVLFALIVAWQMAHFFAISLYRKEEYEAAGLPVYAVVRPLNRVILQISMYVVLYVVVVGYAVSEGVFQSFAGVGMVVAAGWWAVVASQGLRHKNKRVWAKQVFAVSLALSFWLLCMSALGVVLA